MVLKWTGNLSTLHTPVSLDTCSLTLTVRRHFFVIPATVASAFANALVCLVFLYEAFHLVRTHLGGWGGDVSVLYISIVYYMQIGVGGPNNMQSCVRTKWKGRIWVTHC